MEDPTRRVGSAGLLGSSRESARKWTKRRAILSTLSSPCRSVRADDDIAEAPAIGARPRAAGGALRRRNAGRSRGMPLRPPLSDRWRQYSGASEELRQGSSSHLLG